MEQLRRESPPSLDVLVDTSPWSSHTADAAQPRPLPGFRLVKSDSLLATCFLRVRHDDKTPLPADCPCAHACPRCFYMPHDATALHAHMTSVHGTDTDLWVCDCAGAPRYVPTPSQSLLLVHRRLALFLPHPSAPPSVPSQPADHHDLTATDVNQVPLTTTSSPETCILDHDVASTRDRLPPPQPPPSANTTLSPVKPCSSATAASGAALGRAAPILLRGPALYVACFHVPDAGLGPPGPSPSDPTQAALSPLRSAPPHPRQAPVTPEPSPGGHSPTKSAMSPLHAAPPHLAQVLKDTPFGGARRKRVTKLPDTPPNTASALPAVAEALRESIRVTVASFCSAQVLSASGEGVALSQFWTAATTIAQRIRGDANVGATLITGQGRFNHSAWLDSWRAAVPGSAPKSSKTLLHAMRALVQLLLECPHLEFWRPSSLRDFTRTRGYFTSIPDAVYFVFASELVNDCTASSLFQKLRSAVLDARPAPPLPNRRAFLRTHALHGLAFTEARTWWTQIAALRALVTRVCGDDEIFARIDDLELIYTDGEGWKCRPRTPGDTVVDLKRKALEALLNEASRTITDPVARAALEQLYSDLVSGLRAHTSRVQDLFAVAADAGGWVKIRLTQLESDEVPTCDIMRSDYSLAHWIALYCKRLLQQLVDRFRFLWILPVTYQVRSGPLPARALCVAMVWRELADLGQRNVGADMTAPGLVLLNRACILLGLAEPQPTCTAAKLQAIPFWWRARLVRWRHDWMWEVACDAREHSRGMYDETAFRTWLVDQQSLSDVDVARVLPPESTWRDSLLSRPTARMQKRQKQGLEARVYKQTVTQLIIDARRRDDGTWGDCPPWWHREPPATRRIDDDDGATTPVPDDGETEREPVLGIDGADM